MPADAANLHVQGRDAVHEGLQLLWQATAPTERINAQVLPLRYGSTHDFEAAVSKLPASSLARAVWEQSTLSAERDTIPLPEREQRLLDAAREALYERSGGMPDVKIVHAGVMRYAWRGEEFTRGRAWWGEDGMRVVAVALDAPAEQVALQILHEETHPVTDAAVRAHFAGVSQRTDGQGEGGAMHAALEEMVVAVDEAILCARAPQLLPAFERWRAQFGM